MAKIQTPFGEVEERDYLIYTKVNELRINDLLCIRPLRAIILGEGTEEDKAVLLKYEDKSKQLREELRNL